jgi:hypothetical protein
VIKSLVLETILLLQDLLVKSILTVYLVILVLALSIPPLARADWINFTGAQSAPNITEINVEEDHIRLVLEIYVGDLDKFVVNPLKW